MTEKLSPAKASALILKLEKMYGLPEPDLRFNNLYQLTIAVVLSAQTTDIQVNRVTEELFIKYKDFKSLASASLKNVETIKKSTGF